MFLGVKKNYYYPQYIINNLSEDLFLNNNRNRLQLFYNRIEMYHKFIAWINSYNISTKATRFEKYFTLLKTQKNNIIKSTEIEQEQANEYTFLREIDEVNWIYESLNSRNLLDNEIAILRKIVSGNISRQDDIHNDSARDFEFQLRCASYFERAKLLEFIENDSDVEAIFMDRKVHIEAKRIKSFKKLNNRISEAKKQLKKNLIKQSHQSSIGIILVDPYEFLFHSKPVLKFKNMDECTQELRYRFNLLSGTSWVGKVLDSIKNENLNICLIWFNSIVPCFLREENIYVSKFQNLYLPIYDRFTLTGQFTQELTDTLGLHMYKK